jgi:hypothetical protein
VANRRFRRTWPNSHHVPSVAEGKDKIQSPALNLHIHVSQAGKVDVPRRVLAESMLLAGQSPRQSLSKSKDSRESKLRWSAILGQSRYYQRGEGTVPTPEVRQRRGVFQGTRRRRLARTGTQADLDRRPHDP